MEEDKRRKTRRLLSRVLSAAEVQKRLWIGNPSPVRTFMIKEGLIHSPTPRIADEETHFLFDRFLITENERMSYSLVLRGYNFRYDIDGEEDKTYLPDELLYHLEHYIIPSRLEIYLKEVAIDRFHKFSKDLRKSKLLSKEEYTETKRILMD